MQNVLGIIRSLMCKVMALQKQHMIYFVHSYSSCFCLTDFSMLGKRLQPDNLQSSVTAASTSVQGDKQPHSPNLPDEDELVACNCKKH